MFFIFSPSDAFLCGKPGFVESILVSSLTGVNKVLWLVSSALGSSCEHLVTAYFHQNEERFTLGRNSVLAGRHGATLVGGAQTPSCCCYSYENGHIRVESIDLSLLRNTVNSAQQSVSECHTANPRQFRHGDDGGAEVFSAPV